MRRRGIAWLLATVSVLAVAAFVLMRSGLLGAVAVARVKSVPPGDQEIAWIHAATNGATWERFVAGVHRVREHCPHLHVDDQNAFLDQTAAVPELCLSVDGCPSKLWIRWYKLTSETGHEKWIDELARRQPPPLAIIGGGSSDRARDLAKALAVRAQQWHGPPPLFLITTATADKVRLDEEGDSYIPMEQDPSSESWRDLITVYPDRTFRFCFTNSQMAEAVVDFVWSQPNLRPHGSARPDGLAGSVAGLAGGNIWAAASLWLAGAYEPPAVYAVQWVDDPYSIDLSEQFCRVLPLTGKWTKPPDIDWVPYSVGGFQDPNPREALLVQRLRERITSALVQRPLLVLPTVLQPARRVLRAIALVAPLEARHLVAVTGDSINFNHIYRDGDRLWNIQEVPVPLVFFCHQNPVDWPGGPEGKPPAHATATDDMLLNADMMRIIVEAAYKDSPGARDPKPFRQLVADADELATRLQSRDPPFFRKVPADGNRVGGSGEYVVCLLPDIREGEVLPLATIEVWSRQRQATGSRWQRVRSLSVSYGGMPAAGGSAHAGD